MQINVNVETSAEISKPLADAMHLIGAVAALVDAAKVNGLTKEQLKERIPAAIDTAWD